MALEDPSVATDRRLAIGTILANRAFIPVFQPIVDLATGLVVAYEAFSRFDGGRSALAVFADARAVGLDLDLELATLRAALVAARRLPGGRWLDVNASPDAVGDPRFASAIAIADRRIVVEVLAHELAGDGSRVGDRLRTIGSHADLAIVLDDASRTVPDALEPALVKLAPELTLSATTEDARGWLDPLGTGRPGMPIVAEGVETLEQASALARLGVELGQGHHFGRPALATVRPSAVN